MADAALASFSKTPFGEEAVSSSGWLFPVSVYRLYRPSIMLVDALAVAGTVCPDAASSISAVNTGVTDVTEAPAVMFPVYV